MKGSSDGLPLAKLCIYCRLEGRLWALVNKYRVRHRETKIVDSYGHLARKNLMLDVSYG